MRALLLDNLDSFTHNVRAGLLTAGAEVVVVRRDQASLARLEAEAADLLVIGPGPGRPEDAALSLAAIRAFAERCPILGVCHGQALVPEADSEDRAAVPGRGLRRAVGVPGCRPRRSAQHQLPAGVHGQTPA